MDSEAKIVVLAGATGGLGRLIAHALLDKPNVTLRALVRPGSRVKAAALADRGAELIEVALDEPEAVDDVMTGAYSVVSAVQGDDEVIIKYQARMLQSAARTGARRFIPSCFTYNIFGLADGDDIAHDSRRAFARLAEEIRGGVEVIHVLNGCFLDKRVLFDFLGAIDLKTRQAFLWGDGDEKMDFTTYEDTARFTAEAATDPGPLPAQFNVAGDTLDFHELVQVYKEASGKPLIVARRGSLDDLDAEIARRQKEDPGNIFVYLPLTYWRAMLSGKGKLGPLMNSRYPHIHPVTVREFVRREGL